MQPAVTNILDQLLGVVDANSLAKGAASGVDRSGCTSFDALLGQLEGGQVENQLLSVEGETLLTEQPGVMGRVSALEGRQTLLNMAMGVTSQSTDERLASPAVNNVGIESMSILPNHVWGAVPNLESLTKAIPIDLKSGMYQIMDSRVVDGQLELIVTAKDGKSEPILVSVPLKELAANTALERGNGQQAQPGLTPRRTPLIGFPDDNTRQLEQLLSKLNLKTLEIKTEPLPESENPRFRQVQLKFTAEHVGAEIAIKSRLSKKSIVSRKNTVDSKGTKPIQFAETEPAEMIGKIAVQKGSAPRPGLRPVAVPVPDANRFREFTLPDKLVADRNSQSNEMSRLANEQVLDKLGSSASESTDKTARPTVRVVIPEFASRVLRPNGQSILIRIEPDHLGPARLHLTMRHELLTARVMVGTPAAVAALEGSLDQLTQQLSRAGVEVDRIEIALTGQNTHDQLFDQRSQWARSQRVRTTRQNNESEIEQAGPTDALSPSVAQYVSATGVNLLA